METTSRRATVICPKCGEDNADNFRFCGMCGAVLEARVPAGAPRVLSAREGGTPIAVTIPANPAKARVEKQQVEPISGPSLLGLGGQPSLDSLRDRAFSGSDPLFEVEEPKTGGRKILLLLLLAALGAAGWWTYTNYIAITRQEPAVPNPRATLPPSPNVRSVPSQLPATGTTNSNATPANSTSSEETKSQETPSQADNTAAKANVNSESKSEEAATKAEEGTAAGQAGTTDTTEPGKTGRAVVAKAEPSRSPDSRKTARRVSKAAAPPAADIGEAEFRKGEAYLYGRGVRENCDAAIKSLKAASAKLNPRARSAFGTMYATGHCVPRDLPSSYSWFALALRADPNNQILEKDLRAIWNQMTPPERQLATKLKQ
jgi:zinc-ribbon domain